uniref:Ribosomal protein S4 n=1 Tax=Nannochloropsis oculata TaxID=43925 RepID=T1R894_9STRA|nr:ribosomal protein S4 [Nannochloropsis oculata]AGI49015.1 ribosomal protein S4 [Nannochloropsis oculata]AHX24983.1 30S ribosomal protein S4 [Nannochloropsis oculata]
MPIKRYAPKYKKLNRLKRAFWREKGAKIKRFKKQKWGSIKRFYYPRKYKFFNQDKSAYPVNRDFEDEKSVRLKKTYKFLLLDKQRLQLYYGAGRLKYYQLKSLVQEALRLSKKSQVSAAKSALSLVENRLQNLLYRLGYVSSLMEARRLINAGHIQISDNISKNCSYNLKKLDTIKLNPVKSHQIISNYLKQNTLLFYFRHKRLRRKFLYKKLSSFNNSIISNNSYNFYESLNTRIKSLKN